MFLFHIPRSSIQRMPKSRAATSHECPKSWEISSLMTATRNGDLDTGGPSRDTALETLMAAIPATNSRRFTADDIEAPQFDTDEGAHKSTTIGNAECRNPSPHLPGSRFGVSTPPRGCLPVGCREE